MKTFRRYGLLGLVLAIVAMPAAAQTPPSPGITVPVCPVLPTDIPGGAPNATLQQAAVFAWQEFIALNWPAVAQSGQQGNRETADTTKFFSDPAYTSATRPLVWHTYRGKVEIFPGAGLPPGSSATEALQSLKLANKGSAAKPYYGYDALPSYVYSSPIQPASTSTSSSTVPWINLDEKSQIGLDQIYAGVASANTQGPGNQILFAAKANRTEFDYIAPLGWWAGTAGGVPLAKTAAYVQRNLASPPAGSTNLVSFPYGTIELKSAWRKLAPNEDPSRFYTTTARYYVNNSGTREYVDDTFALVALHIIQKTPTAPYFIFATFEQADNITDANGNPVEDADGNFIGQPVPASAFTPDIISQNAMDGGVQTFLPKRSNVSDAGGQLYFQNTPDAGLVDGTVLVNRRKHAIPRDVVLVNKAAHQAIASYVKQNLPGTKSPWLYYKLINVQSAPIGGKIPGDDYTKANAATFYQANSVVETDYNLQVFSGQFYPGSYASLQNTITDFNANGTPFVNVAHAKTGYNMGGCMGCHGNAQQGGADFSFLLKFGPVSQPDAVPAVTGSQGVQTHLLRP